MKDLTPDEKLEELKRHKEIILATIDYQIERYKGITYEDFDVVAYFQNLKLQTEENFQKARLTRLKQWLRDLTAEPLETVDLKYSEFIKEKTGYNFDIFAKFNGRIDKILERKRINTENEYRDVLIIVDKLCQEIPVDEKKIDSLNVLIRDFDLRIQKKKN